MDRPETLIREASENDTEGLTQLMNELGYPTSRDEMCDRFLRIQIQKDYRTLIASHQGHVAGMIGLQKSYYFEKNGVYVRVVALVVKNSHRKMGIGSLLMKAAENWAKEMNANSLILNSGNRPERIAAHQFYNKLGFQNYSSGFRKVL